MVSVLRVILPVLLAVLLSRAWVAVQNEMVNIPIAAPTVQFLRDTYGAERNLTSKETRALYLTLIQEVGIPYQKQLEGAKTTARGLVVACNLLRHRIRLYARYRDIETNPYLLALRDIGVHGLQPMNFQALLDIPVCAFPSLEGYGYTCPSVAALEVRKGQKEEEILASMWKSNEKYNKIL